MSLPRRHRLRGHRAIDHLHRRGRRLQGPHLLVRLVKAEPRLLRPEDRNAPSSPWRCALVISAKVSKRAVVRNRLRRLLHSHLLACLPPPGAPGSAALEGRAQAGPNLLLHQDPNVGTSDPTPSRITDACASDGCGSADPLREPAPQSDGPMPLWLMVSLRPGSEALAPDQLLGECTLLLRRAGLIR